MEKRKEMFDLVDLWKSSRMSQVEFCKTHDLNLPRFRYWVRKKKESESESHFRLIEPKTSMHHVCLIYPNGIKIEAPADPVLIGGLIHLY